MAEEKFAGETQGICRSIEEQLCVNTPMMNKKKSFTGESDKCAFKRSFPVPLSPPPTVNAKQKRERSESLMSSQTNELLVTKRRLRSRSRLGLGPEDIPSGFLSPPCSTKTRERTHSRSQNQNEKLFSYPEEFPKHLSFNDEASSVHMTPASEVREPLQNRDMNSLNDAEVDCHFFLDERRLSTQNDSSDEETISTKLNFDQYAEREIQAPVTPDHFIIGRRMGEKKIDFIKALAKMNCEEICKQIFCNLEPRDLQRVASVSKLWRRICKKDRIASPRLDQFISGRKQHVMHKGKENLGHHTKFENASVPQRPPFTVKDHNMIWTPQQKQSAAAIEGVKTNIMSTFERVKCPSCGSPSRKTTNDVCECDECQEVFCTLCQSRVDKNHKAGGKCGIKLKKSKNAKGREAIGSKKSKDRLRRY